MRELFRLKVSDLARLSGEPLPESDLVVTRASIPQNIYENSILFVKRLTEDNIAALELANNCLILVPEDGPTTLVDAIRSRNVVAPVPNPRLSYAKVMTAAVASHHPGRCRPLEPRRAAHRQVEALRHVPDVARGGHGTYCRADMLRGTARVGKQAACVFRPRVWSRAGGALPPHGL